MEGDKPEESVGEKPSEDAPAEQEASASRAGGSVKEATGDDGEKTGETSGSAAADAAPAEGSKGGKTGSVAGSSKGEKPEGSAPAESSKSEKAGSVAGSTKGEKPEGSAPAESSKGEKTGSAAGSTKGEKPEGSAPAGSSKGEKTGSAAGSTKGEKPEDSAPAGSSKGEKTGSAAGSTKGEKPEGSAPAGSSKGEKAGSAAGSSKGEKPASAAENAGPSGSSKGEKPAIAADDAAPAGSSKGGKTGGSAAEDAGSKGQAEEDEANRGGAKADDDDQQSQKSESHANYAPSEATARDPPATPAGGGSYHGEEPRHDSQPPEVAAPDSEQQSPIPQPSESAHQASPSFGAPPPPAQEPTDYSPGRPSTGSVPAAHSTAGDEMDFSDPVPAAPRPAARPVVAAAAAAQPRRGYAFDDSDDEDVPFVNFHLNDAAMRREWQLQQEGADGDQDSDFTDNLAKLDVGKRLYYAGCGAAQKRQAFVQKERESKILSELSQLAEPKITYKGKSQPSRTDEFRSLGVAQMYRERAEMERLKKEQSEMIRVQRQSEGTHINRTSRTIVETALRRRYKGPVSNWEAHNSRYLARFTERPPEHSFQPNVNRNMWIKNNQHLQEEVFTRLHTDAAKRLVPKEEPEAPNGPISFISTSKQRSMSTPKVDTGSHTPLHTPEQRDPINLSMAGSDAVVNRLLSAGQLKERKRRDTEVPAERFSFHPTLNRHSLELAEERKRKQIERVNLIAEGKEVELFDKPAHGRDHHTYDPRFSSPTHETRRTQSQSRSASANPNRLSRHSVHSMASATTPAGSAQTHTSDQGGRRLHRDFLKRNNQRLMQRAERSSVYARERSSRDMAECTFTPKLCERSESLIKDNAACRQSVEEQAGLFDAQWNDSPAAKTPSQPRRQQALRQSKETLQDLLQADSFLDDPLFDAKLAKYSQSMGALGLLTDEKAPSHISPPRPLQARTALIAPKLAVSPFDRSASSVKDVKKLSHNFEREIASVLDEWNKIQAM
ncbi:hypothetical protein DIPPA_20897 [Diplonema papillatum]|nr:hypothetical protein DIPPA_20897 [Diplonema papillatum]KAJ9450167.1 hypothetical protein DIPPA_20897 [Diplonema papillatum]